MFRAVSPFVLTLLAAPTLLAQNQFDHLQKVHLPELRGSVAEFLWFDADGDGDLDLLPVGNLSQASLLLRTGPLAYSPVPSGVLGSSRHRAAALGDVDGDGDLDVVIAREASNRFLRNAGGGSFVDDTTVALGFVVGDSRAVVLGDLDGDQDLDLVFGNVGAPDSVLANDGAGHFTAIAGALPPGTGSSGLATFDVDGDGDMDLVRGSDTAATQLLLNNGSGAFTVSAGALPVDVGGTLALVAGDLEGDGDLDLLVPKTTGGCRLFVNNGNGTFADATNRLPPALPAPQKALLVDIDNDGDRDVAFCSTKGTVLLRNDGATFADVSSRLPAVDGAAFGIGAADADGDGDVDLFVQSGRMLLFVNDRAGRAFVDASGARIDFVQACSRLADIDGDGDLDLVTAPSVEPAVSCVHVNDGRGMLLDETAARWNPTGVSRTQYAFVVGDVDHDGDQDLVLGQVGQDRLYRNDGSGHFVDATATHLPVDADRTTGLALADLDGDGDLDLAAANSMQANRIWRNDGTGHFLAAPGAMPADAFWSQGIEAADVDGDGDLDLLVADWNTTFGSQVRLYQNDGSGTFTDVTAGRVPAGSDYDGGFAVGDVDADGDLDFVALGALYQNDGSGTFTDATAARMPLAPGIEPRLADLDGDGDLDLVSYQVLLLNDGSGTFTDGSKRFAGSGFLGAVPRPYAVGDVDRDGDLDVVGSYDVFSNLHRHVSVPRLPVVGGTFQVDVHATPGYGTSPSGALLLLATRAFAEPPSVGSFGLLHLRPLSVFAADILSIPTSTGQASRTRAIPNSPALAGLRVFAQALVMHGGAVQDWKFTNVAGETIVR